jgi:hypothetical protein
MKKFLHSLLIASVMGIVLGPTLASADGGARDIAERRRLSEENKSHYTAGRWESIEENFRKILRLKKASICLKHFEQGAMSASELGYAGASLLRLWVGSALAKKGKPEDCGDSDYNKAKVENLRERYKLAEETYGYVSIKAKKGTKVSFAESQFDASVQISGSNAFEQIAKKGKFVGALPVGAYTTDSGATFTVKPAKWAKARVCARKLAGKKNPNLRSCLKKVKKQKIKIKAKRKK